jgi:hypothetical protein
MRMNELAAQTILTAGGLTTYGGPDPSAAAFRYRSLVRRTASRIVV